MAGTHFYGLMAHIVNLVYLLGKPSPPHNVQPKLSCKKTVELAVTWNAIPHVQNYHIIINGSQHFSAVYKTNNSSIIIQNIMFDSVYTLKVSACNCIGCGDYGEPVDIDYSMLNIIL